MESSVQNETLRGTIRKVTTDWEPPYYYLFSGMYKGEKQGLLESEGLPAAKILMDNYREIRDEVVSYYEQNAKKINPNFTPYNYTEKGWKTINLYSYFMRYHDHCEQFPTVDKAVRQIPGMCTCQIAVLEPNTRIKAHQGDSQTFIRTHLGLVVPGTLPDIGLRIGSDEVCWEEGKVFSIGVAKRHYAWNYTDHYRIVLVVDTIRPEFMNKRYSIAGNIMAVVAMKQFATKWPILRKVPVAILRLSKFIYSRIFMLILWLQRVLKLKIEKLIR